MIGLVVQTTSPSSIRINKKKQVGLCCVTTNCLHQIKEFFNFSLCNSICYTTQNQRWIKCNGKEEYEERKRSVYILCYERERTYYFHFLQQEGWLERMVRQCLSSLDLQIWWTNLRPARLVPLGGFWGWWGWPEVKVVFEE